MTAGDEIVNSNHDLNILLNILFTSTYTSSVKRCIYLGDEL